MSTSTPNPVVFRMEWCRRQKTNAHPGPEQDGWQAEIEGLRDALFNRDHMSEYQQASPEVLKRYELGFQDGRTLIRAAWVDLN